MKRYFTLDVVIGIILILFSGWFWFLSLSFPEAAQMFPQLFLIVTFILSILLLITSVIVQGKKLREGGPADEKGFFEKLILPCKAYGIMILYILGVRIIGFFAATSIFMLGFMYFLKVRRPAVLLGVTAGMDLFLYVMFCLGLKLSLPMGVLLEAIQSSLNAHTMGVEEVIRFAANIL